MEKLNFDFSIVLKYINSITFMVGVASVLVLIGLYVKRSSPIVKTIVTNAIIDAEQKFNSGEGQQKLQYATIAIQAGLPFILKFFFSKRMIVTIIESTLNKVSDVFELDKKVDIIGNEAIEKKEEC